MLLIKAWESLRYFLENNFKIRLHNRSGAFVTAFMLSLSKADIAIEILGGKQGTIYPYSTWSFKIILTLLEKVVVFYVGLISMDFRGSILKKALL